MTRHYSQPHPQAIFRDKPTRFIEMYKSDGEYIGENNIDLPIEYLSANLEFTEKLETLTTIALFIIKPKKP